MSFSVPRRKNVKVKLPISSNRHSGRGSREPKTNIGRGANVAGTPTVPINKASASLLPRTPSSSSAVPMAGVVSPDDPADLHAKLPTWLHSQSFIEEYVSMETESSQLEQETIEECLPLLLGGDSLLKVDEHSLPLLDRRRHIKFLHQFLGRLPSPFTGLDASRPWMLYWCTMGLYMLGEDTRSLSARLQTTLNACQSPTGGFGGGHGQYSHTATSYASVLALATAGGGPACDIINRRAMWQWLGRLKQPTGEFQVTEGGENDVRGSFCAMVMASLLNLPNELPKDSPAHAGGHRTLTSGLAEWISKCQTYEGGLASVPNSEAHGAYTFCALACLCMLGDPKEMFNKYLDMTSLISWLTQRQHTPEGGLAGRSNKLVDGCYSHWIGGCWSLIEAACRSGEREGDTDTASETSKPALFNREALARYILTCCQAKHGGLRDKPSKPPDAYHTLYVLAGLSSAQHYYRYEKIAETGEPMKAAFWWTSAVVASAAGQGDAFEEKQQVPKIHPVYVIPWGRAEEVRNHFEGKPLTLH